MKTRVVDTHAAEQQGQLHRAREEKRSESETHRDGWPGCEWADPAGGTFAALAKCSAALTQ